MTRGSEGIVALTLAALALMTAGCRPDLGVCDETASRRVVYDDQGLPAYEGQALVIASCGGGSFCHSEAAAGDDRRGAPTGLDLDLRLAAHAGWDADGEEARLERLRRSQDAIYGTRHLSMEQVERGLMPPPGMATREVLDASPRYARVDPASGERTPLPGLDTEQGRALLRNWMACGTPVVSRTSPASEPIDEPVGFVEPAIDVTPPEPRWPAIHDELIVPRCASAACHGASADGGLALGGGPSAALAALVDAPAAGMPCAPTGARRVVPGDPDASLLVAKLRGSHGDGAPVCGDPMPQGQNRLTDPAIEAVVTWIRDGARPE
ncbi:MAG TPA: hypothetical protein RMH99_18415 [Sandaracinaceae bacterium LLY-WYZ-13_1]|nr:hypothetical protein [Sandaracinaceae bacterium LLY-WYZ-13_1]